MKLEWFPFFFFLRKWDIKDCSWFSITCVNGDRRGVPRVQVSGWMYITHQWLSAELTQFWAGATAFCQAWASPSRAGDDSASHPGSGRRCWRTRNHLRVFVVLCHAVCSLLRGAGCISSPLTSALFKRGSLKGCQDTAANCPDFPSTQYHRRAAVLLVWGTVCLLRSRTWAWCAAAHSFINKGDSTECDTRVASAVWLTAVACTASLFLLLRRWQTSSSLLASDWFILLLFLRTSWRQC